MAKLTDFKCLVFDCYGTLIDWESGLYNGLEPMVQRAPGEALTRERVMHDYGIVEAQVQKEFPDMLYSGVLAETHARLGKLFNVVPLPSDEENAAFGRSVANWEPFPDTVAALARLSKHYKLVVLSNIDIESFSYTKKKLEHGFTFDRIITAQEVGSYKPDLRNFEYALKTVKEELGVQKDQVLVTAQSLRHDHAPANKLGLGSAWINRAGAQVGTDRAVATFDWEFPTMGDMAEEVDKQFGA